MRYEVSMGWEWGEGMGFVVELPSFPSLKFIFFVVVDSTCDQDE